MSSAEMCTGIVKCLGDFWSKKQLLDFTVKIDDVSIECHRFIMEACSDYFEALFRSGMREVKENCVVLQDVSVTVFELILNTLYTGINSLTLDNFIEVWQAVHRLQIRFMVTCCENFAINFISTETWENIYKTANLIESENVLGKLYLFMLKNFEQICQSTTFLKLQFNEIRDLIKSQDLVVRREDVVLESVINWVDNAQDINSSNDLSITPINDETKTNDLENENSLKNKVTDEESLCSGFLNLNSEQHPDKTFVSSCSTRKENLTGLLNLVRTCLVNPTVLSRVYKLKLITENEDARNIIFNPCLYHVIDYRHGQWHSAAVHRHCGEYYHCGVYANSKGDLKALNSEDEVWYGINKSALLQRAIQLVAFDNELYGIGVQSVDSQGVVCRLCVLCNDTWVEVVQMPTWNVLLVSHGHIIFVFNKDDRIIYTVNPKTKQLDTFTDYSEIIDIQHVMTVEHFILVFESVAQNGLDETAVHLLDINSNVWTRLNNIDGPATQIISFNNDQNIYILQTNGTSKNEVFEGLFRDCNLSGELLVTRTTI
ncbi:kelch-like protein 41 [Physella acuta]|uniref:kelch-like protein 41 n=1 Tax=Physella acuta TaxID=109671 RepID=UPI0027DDB4E1|nr:kelch-like protein 41 [Physella acuta]